MSALSFRRFVQIITMILLCGAMPWVAAQQAPDPSNIVSSFLSEYQAVQWHETIFEAADRLFWSLATVSVVWTFGMLLLRGGDIGDVFGEVTRFILVTGIFYWLLREAGGKDGFVDTIVLSMKELGGGLVGSDGGLQQPANTIANIGLSVFNTVVDQSVNWKDTDVLVSFALATFIVVLLALVAAQVALMLIGAWMLAYGGIFLLGFGGARWTSSIAISYYKHVLAVALSLMALILLLSVGRGFLFALYGQMSGAVNLRALAVMLVLAIVLLALCVKVPGMLFNVVTGAQLGALVATASMAGRAVVVGSGAAWSSMRHTTESSTRSSNVGRQAAAVDAVAACHRVSVTLAEAQNEIVHQSMGYGPYGPGGDAPREVRGSSVFHAASPHPGGHTHTRDVGAQPGAGMSPNVSPDMPQASAPPAGASPSGTQPAATGGGRPVHVADREQALDGTGGLSASSTQASAVVTTGQAAATTTSADATGGTSVAEAQHAAIGAPLTRKSGVTEAGVDLVVSAQAPVVAPSGHGAASTLTEAARAQTDVETQHAQISKPSMRAMDVAVEAGREQVVPGAHPGVFVQTPVATAADHAAPTSMLIDTARDQAAVEIPRAQISKPSTRATDVVDAMGLEQVAPGIPSVAPAQTPVAAAVDQTASASTLTNAQAPAEVETQRAQISKPSTRAMDVVDAMGGEQAVPGLHSSVPAQTPVATAVDQTAPASTLTNVQGPAEVETQRAQISKPSTRAMDAVDAMGREQTEPALHPSVPTQTPVASVADQTAKTSITAQTSVVLETEHTQISTPSTRAASVADSMSSERTVAEVDPDGPDRLSVAGATDQVATAFTVADTHRDHAGAEAQRSFTDAQPGDAVVPAMGEQVEQSSAGVVVAHMVPAQISTVSPAAPHPATDTAATGVTPGIQGDRNDSGLEGERRDENTGQAMQRGAEISAGPSLTAPADAARPSTPNSDGNSKGSGKEKVDGTVRRDADPGARASASVVSAEDSQARAQRSSRASKKTDTETNNDATNDTHRISGASPPPADRATASRERGDAGQATRGPVAPDAVLAPRPSVGGFSPVAPPTVLAASAPNVNATLGRKDALLVKPKPGGKRRDKDKAAGAGKKNDRKNVDPSDQKGTAKPPRSKDREHLKGSPDVSPDDEIAAFRDRDNSRSALFGEGGDDVA